MYEYKGCIHVHSVYSDGTGTPSEIIDAANQADIDYLILTDHHVLLKEWEGWYDKVLVCAGEEIGYGTSHYLGFDLKKKVPSYRNSPKKHIENVKKQGGFGFLAHPCCVSKPFFFLHYMGWEDWSAGDFNGVELWTYMHDWITHTHYFNLLSRMLSPHKGIKGPGKEMLEKYDRITRSRKVPAIGGIDAHARILNKKWNLLRYPKYLTLFKNFRNHIITKRKFNQDFNRDSQILYRAMKKGNSFIAHDKLQDSSGFRFLGSNKLKKSYYLMGDDLTLTKNTHLTIKSPVKASIKLIKNGELILCSENEKVEFEINEPGVYRVEVFLARNPWIFTNPIYVNGNSNIKSINPTSY